MSAPGLGHTMWTFKQQKQLISSAIVWRAKQLQQRELRRHTPQAVCLLSLHLPQVSRSLHVEVDLRCGLQRMCGMTECHRNLPFLIAALEVNFPIAELGKDEFKMAIGTPDNPGQVISLPFTFLCSTLCHLPHLNQFDGCLCLRFMQPAVRINNG